MTILMKIYHNIIYDFIELFFIRVFIYLNFNLKDSLNIILTVIFEMKGRTAGKGPAKKKI